MLSVAQFNLKHRGIFFVSVSRLEAPENRLLAALPAEDYQRLLPHFKLVSLPLEHGLFDPDEPPEYVYFPHQCAASIVCTMADGMTAEVGIVGREGMVGVQAVLGGGVMPYRAFVQIAGDATRMPAHCLKAEFDRGGAVQKLLLRYFQAFLTQTSQTAACNRLHMLEARFARWLLMSADAIGKDDLYTTQEFAAQMLGVRRAGVTEVAGSLQRLGLIRYARGRVTILDRNGLEEISCECYPMVRNEFDRLLNSYSS